MIGPRIGGLFEGYGGLTEGVKDVFGGSLAWYSEVDKGALKILGHRFPDVPNVGDVTAVDWSQVEPVDILTGGSPCQDLSHAGRRAGMTEGTRSNLWVAMREAIAQLRPGVVVWENVRGAYSAGADSALEFCAGCMGAGRLDSGAVLRALGRVLGDLSDLGYDARWHGLRAADVGAPHGRFRVFVVAEDASGLRGAQGELARVGGAASGRRTSALPDESDRRPSPGDLTLLPTPAVNDMGRAYTPDSWDAWCAEQQAKHGNGNGHGKSLEIEAQRLLPTPERSDGSGGRKSADLGGFRESGAKRAITLATAVAHAEWGDYAAAIARWEHALGRPAPTPTQTSAKGNPQLSPAFVEWMMGLPAGWVTDAPGITRNEAQKALGNGVVPQQAAAALRTMLAWAEVAA